MSSRRTIITIGQFALPLLALSILCGFRNPPGAARYLELGAKAQAEGRPDEALELYTRGIDLDPDRPAPYLTRAFLLLKLKRSEEALGDFTRYLERQPDSSQGYMSRGMVYSELGRKREAAADFRHACSLGDEGGCGFAAGEKE